MGVTERENKIRSLRMHDLRMVMTNIARLASLRDPPFCSAMFCILDEIIKTPINDTIEIDCNTGEK